jgi:hypothetical protein
MLDEDVRESSDISSVVTLLQSLPAEQIEALKRRQELRRMLEADEERSRQEKAQRLLVEQVLHSDVELPFVMR